MLCQTPGFVVAWGSSIIPVKFKALESTRMDLISSRLALPGMIGKALIVHAHDTRRSGKNKCII
jgi:hypothetical protein